MVDNIHVAVGSVRRTVDGAKADGGHADLPEISQLGFDACMESHLLYVLANARRQLGALL